MILALLLHATHAAIIAYLLSLFFGGLAPWIAIVSLLLGAFSGRKHARLFLDAHPDWRLTKFHSGHTGVVELSLTIFILYVGVRHFMWLLFPKDHGLWTLLGNNLGDLPLHIDYIRAFANGISFPPHNPIFASESLRYPFASDLYNALWDLLGVPLTSHLAVVGVVSLVASLILLRSFGGWWAIGAFFLNGGLNGWQALRGEKINDALANVEWKNLMMTVFIPQRGMLFALPLGLLLWMSNRDHFIGRAPLTKQRAIALGIIWGFLPFFHLHTFVVVSILMAATAVEFRGLRGAIEFFRSRVFLIAVLPATLFILHSTSWLQKASVLKVKWGWLAPQGKLGEFLLYNFGPWLLLPIAVAVGLIWSKGLLKPEERKRLWVEFAVYLGLFVLFFNLMMAPWEWDNIKVLIWPYLGMARLAWVVIDTRMGAFGRLAQAFTFLLSGFVALNWSIQSPEMRAVKIYATGDLANVEGAIAEIPMAKAVFAANTSHDHPLTYFGAMRVMGYEGHIWSHGIQAGDTAQKLEKLMKGEENWRDLARELHVTHIFWGPQEQVKYGLRQKPWMMTLKNVSRVPGYEIYALE